MITLKTLHKATAQEVFDQVASHLLNQNESSYDEETDQCRYRYGDLKCAAGCLIANDEYDAEFESYTWGELILDYRFPDVHQHLIQSLQHVHDYNNPKDWANKLIVLAERHGFDPQVVKDFTSQQTNTNV